MKFVKGMLIGSMVSVGIIMLCNENMNMSKKRMIKKGKQYARKIGIISINVYSTLLSLREFPHNFSYSLHFIL